MGFRIDKQTLNDLAILSAGANQSVYEIFNRTHTRGGAKLLEEMFQHPLSECDLIANRSAAIHYYQDCGMEFPFRAAIFDAIEFYLDNTDTRSQLQHQNKTLEWKMKNLMGADTGYTWIQNGILGCLELLNTLNDFLSKTVDSDSKAVAEVNLNLRKLLDNEKWAWYSGKKKINYEQAVAYDRVFRFEERDSFYRMLHYVYLMDVYIAVARVAKERGFAFASVCPGERNVLKIKGAFHPFLKKPKGNTLEVDENSNVIFLTGANMAGKSTFMKTFSIAIFLAHVGFPVPAEAMEFSVRNGMFTTINLPDNLSMGYSHFYAEVLRLKKVVMQLQQTKKLVIVFDELFRGTNVKDAYDATLAVTEAFAGVPDCLFLISTHIIEVGVVLKERCKNIRFVYLPTKMEGGKPVYTYQLTEGITNDRHGMIIINNEKIIDIINGEGGEQ